jgi:hypothetical protein
MKIDNNKKYSIILSPIVIEVMVATIALASLIAQQPQQQTLAQQTNTTVSNQSAAASSSSNTTANQDPGSVLKLARANVAIDIPLSRGYIDGDIAYFIATDASDKQAVDSISNNTGFPVNYAPFLANTPQSARGQGYIFLNGIKDEGPNGFQLPVANAVPGNKDYSPLWQSNFVKWNDNATTARELKSVEEIMAAEKNGELTITNTDIIVNSPAIKWQSGSLQVKENKNITDNTLYGGGQVLNIDTEKMIVTMVAHRGWGPDGRTVYYIVTDATPEMPAKMMGVPNVPTDEQLATTAVAVDLFQFMNGINGTGPMGFQAGIGAANPSDSNYSPMWRISFIEWKDPSQARVLETLDDIGAVQQAGLITITPAMDGKHVVNCPFFEPSTVFEHQSKSTTS